VAGNVRVGAGCELGSMSSIRQGTTIGSGCTIGMGSVVVADVPDHAVVVGNPARLLRSHAPW
jgi:acetyltransferase EpsM